MNRLACIRTFVQVADAGGFAAAERAGGPPFRASSKQVRRLETSLGTALLKRSTRSVTLTEAGQSYLAYCREILALVDEADASVRPESTRLAGTLRITMAPGYAHARGYALVSGFVAAHPEVAVELETASAQVDMVQSRIDVALRLTRPTDYGLLARRLAPVPLAVVASPRVLARWGAPDDVEALSERPCIVDMQHSFQNRWPVVDGHVRVPSRVRVRGAREAMWFAQAGHGFALVPRLVAESSLDLGILVEVVPGSITAGWSLWAVTVERRLRTARTQAFLDHVVAAHASD